MAPENQLASEKKLPGSAWLVVGLLFIIGALNYLDRTMITTKRSSIIEAMPMTEGQFGLILGGFIADRWSRSHPHARILVPLIGLCIAAPSIFIGSYTSLLPLTILFFMLFSLSRMFVDTNLMPILCMVADPRYRATGYGILNMFATVIGGVGLYAAGIMRDADINLNRMFQSASLIILFCILLLLIIKGWFRYIRVCQYSEIQSHEE
jgi:MFS family permease